MKYLAIFEYKNLTAAQEFDSKTAAINYIKECAKTAKTTALAGEETDKYLIEIKSQKAEINARIETTDTSVKYQLVTKKDNKESDVAYYDTRKAAVDAAKKLIDAEDFTASNEENENGRWTIEKSDSRENITIELKLVLKSSSDDVIASYSATNMKYFCTHFKDEDMKLDTENEILTIQALKDARKKGITNLCIGVAIAAVGGIVSLISYQTAKPGERYTIYTGIIAIGIIDAICGIWYIINPKSALPKDKKKK